jgi:hypothetical protein
LIDTITSQESAGRLVPINAYGARNQMLNI